MTPIIEDYVSFETAKLLKEKGFDVYGDGSFGSSTKVWMEYSPFGKIRDVSASYPSVKGFPAPTLQMAMKWLREVHDILIVVDYEWECDTIPYYFKIYRLDENGKPKQVPVKGVSYDKDNNPIERIIGYRDWERSYKDFSSREEACDAAIKYCLENLI